MEDVIEECAQMKFEKLAEIKFMYKNCDESKFEERDKEIAEVKEEMEKEKQKKVKEAKAAM